MNLDERIARRLRVEQEPRLVREYDAITPTVHVDEPIDRGPVLEQLLDHLEPAFSGTVPPDSYIWGPKGTGKSAVVSALFAHLSNVSRRSASVIPTTTRAELSHTFAVEFIYVDARRARTDFALYHAILDTLVEESVPEHGVSTETLRTKLQNQFRTSGSGAVIAVDHLGEPETSSVAALNDALSTIQAPLSWLAVGRNSPDSLDCDSPSTLELRPYRRQTLEDIITTRASNGLARHALAHEEIRDIAAWAEGDAHDALAAVFGATDNAVSHGRDRIRPEDITVATEAISRPCVSLGRVLALPANRQRVLRQLVDLADESRQSVRAATDAIARADSIDLSSTTITRILYELSEVGIIRRVQIERGDTGGRPPSRVEPRFPPQLFRRLYDAGL